MKISLPKPIAVPHLNDAGLGARKMPNPMHINDVGVKQRVRALPMQPMHANDVGLGMHIAAPGITSSPLRSGVKGMTKNEMTSRRAEIGKMPRA